MSLDLTRTLVIGVLSLLSTALPVSAAEMTSQQAAAQARHNKTSPLVSNE